MQIITSNTQASFTALRKKDRHSAKGTNMFKFKQKSWNSNLVAPKFTGQWLQVLPSLAAW